MRTLWKLYHYLPLRHFYWDITIMKLSKELVFSEVSKWEIMHCVCREREKEGVIIMPIKPLITLDKEKKCFQTQYLFGCVHPSK